MVNGVVAGAGALTHASGRTGPRRQESAPRCTLLSASSSKHCDANHRIAIYSVGGREPFELVEGLHRLERAKALMWGFHGARGSPTFPVRSRNPGHRDDGAGFATGARRPCDPPWG
jgi:hypothetical protein